MLFVQQNTLITCLVFILVFLLLIHACALRPYCQEPGDEDGPEETGAGELWAIDSSTRE